MQDLERITVQYLLYSQDSISEIIGNGITETYFQNDTARTILRILLDYYKNHTKIIPQQALVLKLEELKVPKIVYDTYINGNPEELMGMDIQWIIGELQVQRKKYILTSNMQDVIAKINSNDISEAEQNLRQTVKDLALISNKKKLVLDMNTEFGDVLDRIYLPKSGEVYNTGYPEIDNATGGFMPGTMVLLGALPKIGKTRSMISMGAGLIKQGVNVLVFSLEMPRDQYANLYVSCLGSIQYTSIKRNTLTAGDKFMLDDLKRKFETEYGKLTIIDGFGGVTPDFIAATIEEQELRLGAKFNVVVVDHGTMMKPNVHTGKDNFDQGSIAEDLRSIARKKELTMLVAVQRKLADKPSRKQQEEKDGEKKTDYKAGGEEIGRSLIWYQTADIIMMIQNEQPDESQGVSTLRFKVINRDEKTSTFELIRDFSKTALLSVQGNQAMKGLWEDNKLG